MVFSGAERDPISGNCRGFVVERCNDLPLDNADGPVRLVPDDTRPTRWVRERDSIQVGVTA